MISCTFLGRSGVPLEHFILHVDNASSHTSEAAASKVAVLRFAMIAHPLYSPDLVPFDFALYPRIKAKLEGYRFTSMQELMARTITELLLLLIP